MAKTGGQSSKAAVNRPPLPAWQAEMGQWGQVRKLGQFIFRPVFSSN
jgi:hypothetical protein